FFGVITIAAFVINALNKEKTTATNLMRGENTFRKIQEVLGHFQPNRRALSRPRFSINWRQAMKPHCLGLALCLLSMHAAPAPRPDLYEYVNAEAARLEQQNLDDFKTEQGRARRRAEVMEMFGLSPMPERGDLHATITGRIE